MLKVTTSKKWSYDRMWWPAGTYLLTHPTAAHAIGQDSSSKIEQIKLGELDSIQKFSTITAKSGEKLLIVRPGALGDLLMMTPLIRALRDQIPGLDITVACRPNYASILNGLVKLIAYPMPLEPMISEFHHILWMEDAVENNPRAQETSGTIAMAEFAGIKLTQGTDPDYEVLQSERNELGKNFPRTPGKKRIAVHFQASQSIRSYPPELQRKLIEKLWRKDWEVALLGGPHSCPWFHHERDSMHSGNGVFNLTQVPLSIRQSAAVLATCDLAITVDSVFMHVAYATGVPNISLHGPMHPDIGSGGKAKSIRLVGDKEKCDKCHCHWQSSINALPPESPCSQPGREGLCPVIESISPKQIVKEAYQILNAG